MARAAGRCGFRAATSWRRIGLHASLSVVLALSLPTSTGAQRPSLTGATRIADVYDAIFDARFTAVPALRAAACPPVRAPTDPPAVASPARDAGAPPEVCHLLDAVALWWQIQLNPLDVSRDATFGTRIDSAIGELTAWTEREPSRAEAWFYLGGGYGVRAQFRALRGGLLSAARDGARIKAALERALALDPHLADASFGIGLYHYYADVAPAAARIVRWLLALPGGDRMRGLQEMLRAREEGQLLRDEADYQLHLVYLWYEKKPERSLELLRGLRDRHPFNPLFPQLIAEVQHAYFQDHAASLHTWRDLLARAVARQVSEPSMTETRARLGIATEIDQLFETDLALDQLRIVIGSRPAAPFGAAAEAQLKLGEGLDRLGQRAAAIDAYRAAMAAAPTGDPLGTLDRARAGLRRAPDADAALAYRLSLDGLRALERGALIEADRALARSLALRPDDQVTRYRQARLTEGRQQDQAAIELYERVMSSTATPPTVYADAALDAARLYERQQARARAIELYRRARTTAGADERTRDAAQRALERMGS